MPRLPRPRHAVTGCLVALVAAGVLGATRHDPPAPAPAPVPGAAPPARIASEAIPAPKPAPPGLPRITYRRGPAGVPADPDPASRAPLTEGLQPERRLVVHDAPGGTPRAFLPRAISGLPVVVPIVARRSGWVAVLLPSANRRIGWLPPTGWSPRPLRDRLVVRLGSHELTWLRDGRPRGTWRVSIGARRTPTPLGRTFVLGRTGTRGDAYAGLDALVLAAVPEDREALAPGLRDAHTGIHGWRHTSAFGRSVSNGCVRIPPAAQRVLLGHLATGTVVHVVQD